MLRNPTFRVGFFCCKTQRPFSSEPNKNAQKHRPNQKKNTISYQANQSLLHGDFDGSMKLLNSLKIQNKRPSRYLLENILRHCYKTKKWRTAFSVLEHMRTISIPPKLEIMNLLIKHVTMDSNRISTALAFLDEIKYFSMQPDIISYGTIINAAGRNKKYEIVDQLLLEMENTGITPNIIIFNSILNIYAKGNNYQKTIETFEKLKSLDLKPDTISYTCVIDSCFRSKNITKAIEYYNDMKKNGIQPSEITNCVIINGFTSNNEFKRAYDFFCELFLNGNELNISLLNSILHSISIRGQSDILENIFKTHFTEKLEPNLYSLNQLIKCFSMQNKLDKVLYYFELMKKKNILPNCITFYYLLIVIQDSVLPLSDALSKCIDHYNEMIKIYNLKPTKLIFDCLLRFSLKCKNVDVYKTLLDEMKTYDVPIENLHYNVLIKLYYLKNQDIELTNTYFNLIEQNITIFSFSYSAAIYSFINMNQIHNAYEVFQKSLLNNVSLSIATYYSLLEACKANNLTKYIDDVQQIYNQCNIPNPSASSSHELQYNIDSLSVH